MKLRKRKVDREFIGFFTKEYCFPLTISAQKWLLKNYDKLMECSYLEKDFITYYNCRIKTTKKLEV